MIKLLADQVENQPATWPDALIVIAVIAAGVITAWLLFRN